MNDGLQRIPITKLQPGQFVVDISQQIGHMKVASSGWVRTQQEISELIAKGIVSVTIDTNHTNDTVDDDFSFKDQFGRTPFNDEIENAKTAVEKLTIALSRCFTSIRNEDFFDVNSLHLAAMEFIASIYRNSAAGLALVRVTHYKDYQIGHALRCAAYFATMLRKMKWPTDVAQNWVMGALLHDIGKLTMSSSIQQPNQANISKLQRAEDEFIAIDHVEKGIEIALTVGSLTKETIDVIRLHHEKIDGSGYPDGKKLTDINDALRIFCIVNEFDRLTRLGDNGKPLGVLQAYRKLMTQTNEFDNDMLQRFIQNIGVYPPGTLVKLKSGKVGLVLDNLGNHLKPFVKVIYNENVGHHVTAKVFNLENARTEQIAGLYYGNKRGIFAENYL